LHIVVEFPDSRHDRSLNAGENVLAIMHLEVEARVIPLYAQNADQNEIIDLDARFLRR
jgi:hypothetical protein